MKKSTWIPAITFAMAAASASALDFNWNGERYIPVGVDELSYTALELPEPHGKYWSEAPSRIQIEEAGPNRFIIRPKGDNPEQRLFIVGAETNALYIARISNGIPYDPVVRVHNAAMVAQQQIEASKEMTPMRLIRTMFINQPPAGFEVQPSSTVLLDTPPYRITAREVWSSPTLTGIVADVEKNTPAAAVQFNPTSIQLQIPSLGRLRLVSADKWRLDGGLNRRIRAYLVFAR